jgi:hypothetical protein
MKRKPSSFLLAILLTEFVFLALLLGFFGGRYFNAKATAAQAWHCNFRGDWCEYWQYHIQCNCGNDPAGFACYFNDHYYPGMSHPGASPTIPLTSIHDNKCYNVYGQDSCQGHMNDPVRAGGVPCDPIPPPDWFQIPESLLLPSSPCDQDSDGWTGLQCGGKDFNDNDHMINPQAAIFCEPGMDRNCNGTEDQTECHCPIVLDLQGSGFNLTNTQTGVFFDLNNDGIKEQLSWTEPRSDDSWLVLDRNGNERIDNGSELFSNHTLQAPSQNPNGFIALAEYDKPENGGNLDGLIGASDTIYSSLRLWRDSNHNGISEPAELHKLSAFGIAVLNLDYQESRRKDRHGNLFRWRTSLKDAQGAQIGGWAWEVNLVRGSR